MKKVFVLIAYCLLPTAYCCYSQMQPADSLPGTYAGELWLANPSTNPWSITNDTLFVNVLLNEGFSIDNNSTVLIDVQDCPLNPFFYTGTAPPQPAPASYVPKNTPIPTQ
ncbi:MAG: hypothetical protein HY063_12670 [Bacteroidetes bacterium]|nr:hypothetical protein [Bacteroidota bacterium]